MKKICIITSMIYPVPAVKGGAVEGLVELLIRMNEIYNQLDLTVVSVYDCDAKKESEKYKNTKFVYVNRNSIFDKILSNKIFIYINKIGMKFKGKTFISMPYIKKAFKILKKKNFDRYILEGGGDCYNFGYLSKKIPQEKLYVHFHGEVSGEKAIQMWFGKCITVSNFIARRLICNGIVDSNKVAVLHNCFDEESMKTKISRADIRKKYNIEEDETVFIYWGRLLPEKGVYELIKAYEEMGDELDKTKLLILGNANFGYSSRSIYDSKIEALCNNQKINNRVVFTGFVPHDEMGSILAACDIGIIPSVWDDPAPLTVFEGLSKGLPLIVGAVGGIPEIIHDGVNGILVKWSKNYSEELSEKMIELKNNQSIRDKISLNAIESVKKYSPEKYYKYYLQLIES